MNMYTESFLLEWGDDDEVAAISREGTSESLRIDSPALLFRQSLCFLQTSEDSAGRSGAEQGKQEGKVENGERTTTGRHRP
jgi:hypothetical protein